MFYNVRNEIIFTLDSKKKKMFPKDNSICSKLFVNVSANIDVPKKSTIPTGGGVSSVLEAIINTPKGKTVYSKH